MDVLLVLNITVAVLILMTTIYVRKPLDFSVFPSLLLMTTLTRLVLNVATTRLILSNTGGGDRLLAAGHVIKAFGQFVTGNSPAIGFIIFVILVVIQFVVITKGATRISEVAARFVLDAMPQKQMSVDADLNAGLIDEATARRRRREISGEADFYGAMDGASKFVRGDAIAGIIITLINILGGLAIGVFQHGMSAGEAAAVFTRLTIGDGLVSQIPAFIISVSAGLVVTRSTAEGNLGEDLIRQITSKPVALYLAAGFLALLLPTPLPKIPLLFLAVGCVLLGRSVSRRQRAQAQREEQAARPPARPQERAEDLLAMDLMELEVGVGLISLVEPSQGGDLLDRIAQMRRQLAVDLGLVVPPIRIRDNLRLDSNEYEIKIRGASVARGAVYPGELLAMSPGAPDGRLAGRQVREPAFGLPAVWTPEAERGHAEALGYTVVDASSVLATHLTETVKRHADELLTRQATQALVDAVRERAPKLVEEVLGETLKVGALQKVLQNLLHEGVSIRDIETILEAVGDVAGRTKDVSVLTEYARNALARPISLAHRSDNGTIYCITMDPALEDTINAGIDRTDRGAIFTLAPQTITRINEAVAEALPPLTSAGHEPILLCSPQIRHQVKRMTEPVLPNLVVLSFNEIVRDVDVEALGMVAVPE